MKNIFKFSIVFFLIASWPVYAQVTNDDLKKITLSYTTTYGLTFENPPYLIPSDASYSPNGQQIGYRSQASIMIVSSNGGNYTCVGNSETIRGLICFTPDSREMVFSYWFTQKNGDVLTSYYLIISAINIETKETRVIMEQASWCAWSKSGRYFAYVKQPDYRKPTTDVIVVDTLNGEEWSLGIRNVLKFGFTTDENSLIMLYNPIPTERPDLYTISIRDRTITKLPGGSEVRDFSCSNDGDWIAFIPSDLKKLKLYHIPSKNIYDVFEPTNGDMLYGCTFSPDGRKILLTTNKAITATTTTGGMIYTLDFTTALEKISYPTGVDSNEPVHFAIKGNYPNPFNPYTTIEFSLPESGFVNLIIYNITGQKVRELVKETMEQGFHSVVWDGRDDSGMPLSSGMYLSHLCNGGKVATQKMIIMK